jgi:chromosome segregation ATPase
METQTLAALGAVLLGLMAFALYLFYTRRKSVAEFNRRKEQRDDVTLHVRLGDISERKMSGSEPKDVEIAELKSKLGTTEIMLRESHGELTQARDTITALTAERDNYRELWEKELDRATKFYRECERLDKLAEGYHDKVVSLESKCRWAVQERDEARAFANDLSEQLDRALAVIKDLEGVNAELLAMVQGEDEVHPEAKPLRLVTDLGENECIHCPTEPEAEAI